MSSWAVLSTKISGARKSYKVPATASSAIPSAASPPASAGRYHALLQAFQRLTGCPVLANTSFNVRGEPIVDTPEDAFRRFMGTGLDRLAIGNCLLDKAAQNPALAVSYEHAFAPG